jgi:nitrate reductase NapE component
MANLLDTLRARRTGLARVDGRAVWQRTSAMFGGWWSPRRGRDASLPNWLHLLVGMSDDGLRIPGTNVRMGLDAVLGALLPGAGDALGGVTAAMLMFVAWQRGAPRQLLLKMLGNASLDIAFGAIPIVGDIFDLGFHANRKNLSLLEGHLEQKSRAQRASRAALVLMLVLLGVLMLVAIAGAIGLIVWAWKKWVQGA